MVGPSVYLSFSQDVRDIRVLESWAYHRTLIGEHPVPCLTCGNRLSEDEIIILNSLFLARRAMRAYKRRWYTGLLSWLTGIFTKK